LTVVVTGASGHVGTNLVHELLRRGRRVRVLLHRDERSLRDLDVERVRGNVLDLESLRSAFEGADVLYHLAGLISIDGGRRGRVQAINVDGVANAAQAALDCGLRRMLHFSSIHAFRQEPVHEPLDESRARVGPEAPAYDRSKAGGEERVRAAVERGLDAVILNPTGIIGPNDRAPSRMGRTFLDYVQRRLPASVPGGFDFVDVRDVVASALAAEERGRSGESYLLGGHWHSIVGLMAIFEEVTGLAPPRVTAPLWLARLGAPFLQLWGRAVGREPLYTGESLAALQGSRNVCCDKAARELGHEARPTRESVEAIYKSFLASGELPAGD
jgi:dihydroflavonol-4-reductase